MGVPDILFSASLAVCCAVGCGPFFLAVHICACGLITFGIFQRNNTDHMTNLKELTTRNGIVGLTCNVLVKFLERKPLF